MRFVVARVGLLSLVLATVFASVAHAAPVRLTPGDILYSGHDYYFDDEMSLPHLFHIDGETAARTEIGPYAGEVLAESPTSVLLRLQSGVLHRLDLTSDQLTPVASGLPSASRLVTIDAAGRVYYVTSGAGTKGVHRLDLATQTTTTLFSGAADAATVDPHGIVYLARFVEVTPADQVIYDLFRVDPESGDLVLLETLSVGRAPDRVGVDLFVGPAGERFLRVSNAFTFPVVSIFRTPGSPGGSEYAGGGDDAVTGPDIGPSGEAVFAVSDIGNPWRLIRKRFGQPAETLSLDMGVIYPSIDVVNAEPPPDLGCEVAMSQPSYVEGESVVIANLRFANRESTPVATRLRLQLKLPIGAGVVADAIDLGADGSFSIPANFDKQLGPVTMFTLNPQTPLRGAFEWRCAFEDPVTGDVISEQRANFVLLP